MTLGPARAGRARRVHGLNPGMGGCSPWLWACIATTGASWAVAAADRARHALSLAVVVLSSVGGPDRRWSVLRVGAGIVDRLGATLALRPPAIACASACRLGSRGSLPGLPRPPRTAPLMLWRCDAALSRRQRIERGAVATASPASACTRRPVTVTAAIAAAVYEWVGLEILRSSGSTRPRLDLRARRRRTLCCSPIAAPTQ